MHAPRPQPSLCLLPITPTALRSELAADGRLATHLQAEVPSEWPHADWEPHVLQLLLSTLTANPGEEPFHRYILWLPPTGTRVLVGTLGGFCWPDDPGSREIGYAILPAFRRQGLATAAARLYLEWLQQQPGPPRIIAQTFPHLEPSLHILRRLGFRPGGVAREPGAIAFFLPQP